MNFKKQWIPSSKIAKTNLYHPDKCTYDCITIRVFRCMLETNQTRVRVPSSWCELKF